MYHSISDADENGIHPYYRTTTSPAVFAEQMRFLHDNGYTVIGLNEAVAILEDPAVEGQNKASGPGNKYAVLTFDDGFRDFLTEAFPVFDRYFFPATVFLSTGFVGKNTRKKFKSRECLLWHEIRELDRMKVVFGSHTITHPVLIDLKKEEVEKEVRRSKEEIEDRLGTAVRSFSYPFAFPDGDSPFTKQLRSTLEACGYENGVCTRIGTSTKNNADTFFLSRIPVNSCDDAGLFKAKLEGGYDWIHGIQYEFKRLKRSLKL
jgi:peptidoglycan/xylan/chitin deacetylase (PgdA/CDA1 family)